MGLFDEVVGGLGSSAGGGQGLAASVLEMLSNRQGGIGGLAAAFQQNGLGHLVTSWIGTGANLPVSAKQIQQVLGSDQVQEIAQKAGIAPEAASAHIAEVLPDIIDKLTPAGAVPERGDLMSTGMSLLQGLLSRGKAAT